MIRYFRPAKLDAALELLSKEPKPVLVAGGTEFVPLARSRLIVPETVVDISRLDGMRIESDDAGSLRIGALSTLNELAHSRLVASRIPALGAAAARIASEQIRNLATLGGNLTQRPRCSYFRDGGPKCEVLRVGSGCSARDGVQRHHAALQPRSGCIATLPSDLGAVLLAADAQFVVASSGGERIVDAAGFYAAEGTHTQLKQDEVIVAVLVPHAATNRVMKFSSVADRAGFAFALVSLAAAVCPSGGNIEEARFAVTGLAPVPVRLGAVEAAVVGRELGREAFETALDALPSGSVDVPIATLKVKLVRGLGSRLIDRQSQNKTVAARATADRKVFAHLS